MTATGPESILTCTPAKLNVIRLAWLTANDVPGILEEIEKVERDDEDKAECLDALHEPSWRERAIPSIEPGEKIAHAQSCEDKDLNHRQQAKSALGGSLAEPPFQAIHSQA
jgi:hypothetical protein